MTQVNNDDLKLVTEVLSGDPEAFRLLIEKHQKLVWHIVFRMVQNTEDSNDLCQDVFLRVYNKLDSFRFESKLSTWIGKIAFNIASRHLQRKKIPLVEQDNNTQIIDTVADDIDLTTEYINQEMRLKLHEVVRSLAPVPRTILTLYYLDELSISEVAEIVEKPEGTIKNALFRARTTLKAKLTLLTGHSDE